MKGSPVFFIIFIRPTMQHQPPHHPPYAFLWARLTFAYEEYLHVRVEVTRERIWKSQDAHRARNNTRCKNEIFHAVRTKWYALSAPLGSKAHTSILLHPTPVSTTIVIRTFRIDQTRHGAFTIQYTSPSPRRWWKIAGFRERMHCFSLKNETVNWIGGYGGKQYE